MLLYKNNPSYGIRRDPLPLRGGLFSYLQHGLLIWWRFFFCDDYNLWLINKQISHPARTIHHDATRELLALLICHSHFLFKHYIKHMVMTAYLLCTFQPLFTLCLILAFLFPCLLDYPLDSESIDILISVDVLAPPSILIILCISIHWLYHHCDLCLWPLPVYWYWNLGSGSSCLRIKRTLTILLHLPVLLFTCL